MANQEHLDILEQGVGTWNLWRLEYADIRPDLSQANLMGDNFSRANLMGANLIEADLMGAILNGADLDRANLIEANLMGADLIGARLIQANLMGANLFGTNLSEATIGLTSFGDHDFRQIKGLETIVHRAPSSLSINTVYRSEGDIPEAFVRGTGASDTFIDYMHSLVGKPIEYYSCFISYSSKDDAFARRLYADLQSQNVRCWFAPHDLKIGERIRDRIDESIRVYDKLLLILSEHSIASDWVEGEVEAAL